MSRACENREIEPRTIPRPSPKIIRLTVSLRLPLQHFNLAKNPNLILKLQTIEFASHTHTSGQHTHPQGYPGIHSTTILPNIPHFVSNLSNFSRDFPGASQASWPPACSPRVTTASATCMTSPSELWVLGRPCQAAPLGSARLPGCVRGNECRIGPIAKQKGRGRTEKSKIRRFSWHFAFAGPEEED